MMAGPQIMSANIFVIASKPVKLSAYFLAPVAIAATVSVAIFFALGNNFSLGDTSANGSTGHIIQYVFVGMLVSLAIKDCVRRETIEPPQLVGEHHRLLCVYRADPLLRSNLRKGERQ